MAVLTRAERQAGGTEPVTKGTKGKVVEAPTIEIRLGERTLVVRLCTDPLGNGAVPVLLADIIAAANEIYVRRAAGAGRYDDLESARAGREWRIEQWVNQINRAAARLKVLGALVSDDKPVIIPPSPMEKAHGVPAAKAGEAK